MNVAVVGLGLIGGSIALATRAKGFDVNADVRRLARARDIQVSDDLSGAVRGADVVVLAVPPDALAAATREASAVTPGAVFTDVASSKGDLEDLVARAPRGVRFVGGHPLAGSTRRGIEAAEASLFRDRAWAIVPTSRSDVDAVGLVGSLAREVGARPIVLSVERHEILMRWVVRAPFAVASALAWSAATESPEGLVEVAGPGFRDTTRLAGTPADLADELLLRGDALAVASVLRVIATTLADWADEIVRGDLAAVRAELDAARDLRAQLDRANDDKSEK